MRLQRSRRMALRAAALVGVVLIAACASGPETRRVEAQVRVLELADVPFFPQEERQCGPAALATVLAASGLSVDPDQLSRQVFVPKRGGSLQAELVAAARRHGRIAYALAPHIDAALRELEAGRPVLLLQNLGIGPWPVWHYAVLVGYDPAQDAFILRSGRQRRLLMRTDRLLRTWDRGGRWMIVTVAPGELPVSAEPGRWLQAVAPMESVGRVDEAAAAYEAASARWPREPMVWAALGNASARREDWGAALRAYRSSLELDPDAALVRNNYAWALLEAGCRSQAGREIEAALAAAPAAQRAILQQTQQEILQAAGSAQPSLACVE